MTVPKRIIAISEYATAREAVAVGAILPGHLIEYDSSLEVQVHSTASGNQQRMIAVEDGQQGKDCTDAYSADDIVFFRTFLPGDEVQMRVKNGESINKSDLVESAGNGEIQLYAVDSTGIYYPMQIVGQALETVDMSDSTLADPDGWIKIRIL